MNQKRKKERKTEGRKKQTPEILEAVTVNEVLGVTIGNKFYK